MKIRTFLTKEQMQKVDDLAVLRGMKILQMMENAGYQIASLIRKKYSPRNVLVLAGKGNNGGDALVVGRRLADWGFNVRFIFAESPVRFKNESKHQIAILQSMRADMKFFDTGKNKPDFDWANIIVDGLLGYNVKGNPKLGYKELIELANSSGKDIIAIDAPSGLNVTTGEPYEPCIKAKYTVTLALPKIGLARNKQVGDLFLADIGVPSRVYQELGLNINDIFQKASLIEIKT